MTRAAAAGPTAEVPCILRLGRGDSQGNVGQSYTSDSPTTEGEQEALAVKSKEAEILGVGFAP